MNTDPNRGGLKAYVPTKCQKCDQGLNFITAGQREYNPQGGGEWLVLWAQCPNYNKERGHTLDYVYDRWRRHDGLPTNWFTEFEAQKFGWPTKDKSQKLLPPPELTPGQRAAHVTFGLMGVLFLAACVLVVIWLVATIIF